MKPSDVVRAKLRQAQISIAALREALGWSTAQASRVLGGRRGIPEKHYPAIAALLTVTVPDLLDTRTLRADPTHPKDFSDVTSSVTENALQRPVYGETSHDVAADRRSQLQQEADRIASYRALLVKLHECAETIRRISDDLRDLGQTPATGTDGPVRRGSRRVVPRATSRRKARR